MKKVLCLTKYSKLGASSRVRILSNVESYLQAGYQFDVEPLLSDSYLNLLYLGKKSTCHALFLFCMIFRYLKLLLWLLSKKRYDLIYVEYEIFPYAPWFIEKIFYKLAQKFIVEFDDPIYLKYKRIPVVKNKSYQIALNADLIIVSSVVMKEYFRQLNAAVNIVLLDTPIDKVEISAHSSSKGIVGWIGTPSTQIYLKGILNHILPVIYEQNWRLEIIGSSEDFEEYIPTEFRSHVRRINWFPGIELQYLPNWSIGLLPLDQSEWTYARDCYKAHMYMSFEVYSLCTAIPATVDFVNKYNFGAVVDTDDDWAKCITGSINEFKSNSVSKPSCNGSFYREYYVAKAIELMNGLS